MFHSQIEGVSDVDVFDLCGRVVGFVHCDGVVDVSLQLRNSIAIITDALVTQTPTCKSPNSFKPLKIIPLFKTFIMYRLKHLQEAILLCRRLSEKLNTRTKVTVLVDVTKLHEKYDKSKKVHDFEIFTYIQELQPLS